MLRIKAFEAIHPPFNRAAAIASPPYDVMNTAEARVMAGDSPDNFLHVIRPEIDLPEGTDLHDEAVYAMAASNFQRLRSTGVLVRDRDPGLFLYRQALDGRSQIGIVCCCRVQDYLDNVIRKHERTRQDKEDDRTRHMRAVDANTGPVFLTYRDHEPIDHLIAVDSSSRPLFHFRTPDGVTHTGWSIPEPDAYIQAFEEIPQVYVADGHHRSASAARAARDIADEQSRDSVDGSMESDWFLSVLFPASQLTILPYNRVVKTKGALAGPDAIEKLGALGELHMDADPEIDRAGSFGIYLDGRWMRLDLDHTSIDWKNPIASLDVSLLHDRILEPYLGIVDERTDPNIDFVGGIRGTGELASRVDTYGDAIAFSLMATTIEQLLDVADAGLCMPPKSTWFEPKLRSGLFVHALDSIKTSDTVLSTGS
ncbi:MAG: DUF1015 family protein [Planctomycetota bacterium]|nr:DUF1015 family protein [Planctomycetota bacterium]